MSGFRKKHSCQSVILRFVQDKIGLDQNKYVCAALTDLSRAFEEICFQEGTGENVCECTQCIH